MSSIIGATDEGRMVGHLVIGAGMINDATRLLGDFPAELNIKVQHLVLSSHGTTEFGSPKEPLFRRRWPWPWRTFRPLGSRTSYW